MAKNLCAKRVTPENAYEVWQSPDKEWTYWVLKKYQADDDKPFARWLVFVKSPAYPNGWPEDGYVTSITQGNIKLDFNPLVHTSEQEKPDEAARS